MCRVTIKSHSMQSIQIIFAEFIELLGKVLGTRDGIYTRLSKFLKKAKWKPEAGPGKARLPVLNKHFIPDGTAFKTESTGSHVEVFPGRPSSQTSLGPTQYRVIKTLPVMSSCDPGSDSKHTPERFC